MANEETLGQAVPASLHPRADSDLLLEGFLYLAPPIIVTLAPLGRQSYFEGNVRLGSVAAHFGQCQASATAVFAQPNLTDRSHSEAAVRRDRFWGPILTEAAWKLICDEIFRTDMPTARSGRQPLGTN